MPNPFYQGIQKVVSSARCSSSFQELWFMPTFKVGMSNPRQTHRSVESPQIGPHPSLGAGRFRLTPSGVPSVLLETCFDGILRRLCLAWASGVGPMARISGLFLEAVFLWCSSGYRPDPASPVQTLGFVAGGIFMPQDHGGKADLSNQSSGSGPTPLLAEVCLPEICSILPAASSGNILAGS